MLNEQGSNVGVGQAQCKVSGSKLQDLGIILQNLICIYSVAYLAIKEKKRTLPYLFAFVSFFNRLSLSLFTIYYHLICPYMYYVPVTAHLKNNHPVIFESNFPIIFVTLTFSGFSLSNRATIRTFRIVKFKNVHLKNTILPLFFNALNA